MTTEKHKDAKGFAWACFVVMLLCVVWLVYGLSVDYYGWASLIFFGPAILIFFLAAIAGIVALLLAAKYKHVEENSTLQEELPVSYFESKILAENTGQIEGSNKDSFNSKESAKDINDKSN